MEYVSFLIEKHPEEKIYILPRSSAEEVARKLISHFSRYHTFKSLNDPSRPGMSNGFQRRLYG